MSIDRLSLDDEVVCRFADFPCFSSGLAEFELVLVKP
jgi:hypothetical protein